MPILPRKRNDPELLDLPGDPHGPAELAGSLADIRMVNRFLGGRRAALHHFARLAECIPGGGKAGPISVLDVGAGSADIPVALAEWARGADIDIRVTAVDINPAVVEVAREHVKGYPEITVAVADGLDLPFPDSSFDLVHSALTLHHFPEDKAGLLLKSLASKARHGYIVGDLRRSWAAYWLIYIISRVVTKNRLTRCDGPLSVLRSYTEDELVMLAEGAGLKGFKVVRHPFWRMALVGGRQCLV